MLVLPHALDRFREHVPEADDHLLRQALARAEEIDAGVACAICGRRIPNGSIRGRYRLAADRRGIFVLDAISDVLVTYLRLEHSQQEFCRSRYGVHKSEPDPGERRAPGPVPTRHKMAFRYWLGYLLGGDWTPVLVEYDSKMTAAERKAARLAVIDGPTQVERGICRFLIGEREAVAYEVSPGRARVGWPKRRR